MKEKKVKEEIKEQGLFGEADMVYNTIHTELTIIKETIERFEDVIARKEEAKAKLLDRKECLEEAANIAKKNLKSGGGKEPGEEAL